MNNIYVDKLPETLAKSVSEDDVNTTEVRMWFKSDVKISPLSDRLAEERKKVVQEIKKVLDIKASYSTDADDDWLIQIKESSLYELLDQIERGK